MTSGQILNSIGRAIFLDINESKVLVLHTQINSICALFPVDK